MAENFERIFDNAAADKGRRALTDEIQKLYRQYMHQEERPAEYSEKDAKQLADRMTVYGFEDVTYQLYHMTKDFAANEYMALLRTYPNHMELEPKDRERLFDGIFRAIEENGG